VKGVLRKELWRIGSAGLEMISGAVLHHRDAGLWLIGALKRTAALSERKIVSFDVPRAASADRLALGWTT
jgi:hypothetical protein